MPPKQLNTLKAILMLVNGLNPSEFSQFTKAFDIERNRRVNVERASEMQQDLSSVFPGIHTEIEVKKLEENRALETKEHDIEFSLSIEGHPPINFNLSYIDERQQGYGTNIYLYMKPGNFQYERTHDESIDFVGEFVRELSENTRLNLCFPKEWTPKEKAEFALAVVMTSLGIEKHEFEE